MSRNILAGSHDHQFGWLFMDGFDDAIIGRATRVDGIDVVAYDEAQIIKLLIAQGMTRDEAREYFSFNQAGAWVGEGTPIMVDPHDLTLLAQIQERSK